MRDLKRYSKEFFLKIPTNPIVLKPFNPKAKIVGGKYRITLNELLSRFGIEAEIKGSTALEIEGKGEVDLRIFVPNKIWFDVVRHLANYYKKIEKLEDEYARFADLLEGFEMEIVLLRGRSASVEKKLSRLLKDHPKILKRYIEVKRKYAYSKREYLFHKHKFFESILRRYF